ncbi:MAG TPA: hypothetical protein VF169_14800 [Albitalea sp.]|uniref:hypothetical protein n=1 Tax=Piscinibacter sp. TaxID=1903157 RepID=UPI002ED4EB67
MRALRWLALLAILAAPALPGAAAEPLRLGINMLWIPGDAPTLRERFRKARALGISEVRLDWEWRQAEARRGVYTWDKFDTLVRTAQEEGVTLLPIVHYAPAWAVRGDRKPDDVYELAPKEDAFADYARFLLAAIQRYGPGGNASVPFTPIYYWQAWNEPNIRQFWGPKPDPAAYARLMQEVQRTLQPVRSSIRIVHAGLSKSDLEFMWQLWDANPRHGDTFDIMAVHPYVFDWDDGIRSPEAMDRDESKPAAMGFVGSVKDSGYLGKVFNLQLFMTLRGALNKPIWITEMGYFVAKHRLGVTEAGQAQRLVATVDFVRKRLADQPFGPGARAIAANVQRLYWFSLEDYPSPEGLGSFGMFRPDGTLRPAGEALRNLPR